MRMAGTVGYRDAHSQQLIDGILDRGLQIGIADRRACRLHLVLHDRDLLRRHIRVLVGAVRPFHPCVVSGHRGQFVKNILSEVQAGDLDPAAEDGICDSS